MSMVYFIGGAPRTGKTTVLKELLSMRQLHATSTDAIRSVIKGVLSPEDNPSLFKTKRGEFGGPNHLQLMRDSPEEALVHELAESRIVWESVKDYLKYYARDGLDIAIEGIAILPELLAKSNLNYRVVYIVNLGDQTESILAHARAHPSDWLSRYDDETIKAFAAFNGRMNRYYYEEATKYGFTVVEIDPSDFQSSVERAARELYK